MFGDLNETSEPLIGQSAGAATVPPVVLSHAKALTGLVVVGTASVPAVALTHTRPLTGVSVGFAMTPDAVLSVTRGLQGTSSGTAAPGTVAFLSRHAQATGTAAGTSAAFGSLIVQDEVIHQGIGQSRGQATVPNASLKLQLPIAMVGTASGVAAASATMVPGEARALVGTSAGTSGVMGAMVGPAQPLAGSSRGSGLLVGDLRIPKTNLGVIALKGLIETVVPLNGVIDRYIELDGEVGAKFTPSGTFPGGDTSPGG
jgi:hypothetical protein